MAGQPQELPPGELARLDQIAAELGGIVALAVTHADVCTVLPAGSCVGVPAINAVRQLTCGRRVQLLEEAVAQLAYRTQPAAPQNRPRP